MNDCEYAYRDMWYKFHVLKEITEEEFLFWYKTHCAKCEFMNEICMAGEE